MEDRKEPRYYDTDKLPLLIQGFDAQVTRSVGIPILEDSRDFVTKVDRGVVNYLDFSAFTLAQLVNGLRETDYNGSMLTLLAGGQSLLKNEPAERYDYAIDLGERDEMKIPVIINGGQTITSKLFIPDLTSSSPTSPALVGQLLAHYTTRKHDKFLKEKAKFSWGLGLKRQAFRLKVDQGVTGGTYSIEDVIPKNQGPVIGFSLMYMTDGGDWGNNYINVAVDDLGVIVNVLAPRFSRLTQRDPFIQWISLEPGATFKLSIDVTPGWIQLENAYCFITFYFGN